MAAAVQLNIGSFTFDVEGEYFPRLEAEYKPASQPRQLVSLRETWEVRGARILTADGSSLAASVASTWARWATFRATLAQRGGSFPSAVAFKSAAGATLYTLGPSTHEDFQVDGVDGGPDPAVPSASYRSSFTVTLRFSAVQRFAENVTGIVGWDQTVENTYQDGRRRLAWRTRLTTLEGVSALTKAQSYAALTTAIVAALGSTFLYETNGPYGIETTETDADQPNSRVPTSVEVLSAVRAYGTTIGSVTPGNAPSDVAYSITSRSTPEEKVTTTVAEATGPNALTFVMTKRPAVFNEEELLDEQAKMVARGTWSQRTKVAKDEKLELRFSLKATLAGGGRAVDFEAVADGGEPVEFLGAFQPVTAAVDVELTTQGIQGKNAEMKLPGAPGTPWRFDSAASTEGSPFVDTPAESLNDVTWKRQAHLVFRAPKAPTTSIVEAMLAAQPVDSYVYPAGAS